VLEANLHV